MRKRQAEKDFTEAQLPHDRVQAFFDCLSLRWRTFLRIGADLLLFLLPLLAVGVVRDTLAADALQNGATEAAGVANARSAMLFFDALSIPAFTFASLAFSGCAHVVREVAWADCVFYRQDFKTGIKNNGKIFALTFALAGTIVFLSDLALLSDLPPLVKGLFVGFAFVFLLPLLFLTALQSVVYKTTFFGALRNAFYLFAKSVFPSVACGAVVSLPLLFLLIGNTVVKHLCLAAYAVLFAPYVCLGTFLCGCSILDKHINAVYHKEIVDKGIARLTKNVSEEEK